MSGFEIYSTAGVLVFLIGLLRLITGTQLVRMMLALQTMGSGAFLVLIATAYRNRAPDPDPVPHAMVLTGIVVTMSVTAFGIALIRRLHALTGRVHLVAMTTETAAEELEREAGETAFPAATPSPSGAARGDADPGDREA